MNQQHQHTQVQTQGLLPVIPAVGGQLARAPHGHGQVGLATVGGYPLGTLAMTLGLSALAGVGIAWWAKGKLARGAAAGTVIAVGNLTLAALARSSAGA